MAGEGVKIFREGSKGGGSCKNIQKRPRRAGEGVERFRKDSEGGRGYRKIQKGLEGRGRVENIQKR